jgi:hypothetical protein
MTEIYIYRQLSNNDYMSSRQRETDEQNMLAGLEWYQANKSAKGCMKGCLIGVIGGGVLCAMADAVVKAKSPDGQGLFEAIVDFIQNLP